MKNSGFENAFAVVTGGTSGIGAAVVRALAERGCRVFFCGRSSDGNGVADSCGGLAEFAKCDLTRTGGIETWIADVLRRTGGKIDYLVNNAAFDGRLPFEDASPEAFDRFLSVNLRAAVQTTRLALPGLRAGRGKSVVNMGTTNWMIGLAPFTLYSAAKSGLVGFTRAFAREFGPEGIRANMVSPGWIMTEKQLRLYVTEQDKKDLLRDQALPFLLEEKHIVPVVMFLLSEESCAVTGQNLVADGGKRME